MPTNRLLSYGFGVLCRDGSEPARLELMVKYAAPDTIAVAETAGTSAAPEQFDVVATARLLGVYPRRGSTRGASARRQRNRPADSSNGPIWCDNISIDAGRTTDVTYLNCGEGDMFRCAVRDGHPRRALGCSIADHRQPQSERRPDAK